MGVDKVPWCRSLRSQDEKAAEKVLENIIFSSNDLILPRQTCFNSPLNANYNGVSIG